MEVAEYAGLSSRGWVNRAEVPIRMQELGSRESWGLGDKEALQFFFFFFF